MIHYEIKWQIDKVHNCKLQPYEENNMIFFLSAPIKLKMLKNGKERYTTAAAAY